MGDTVAGNGKNGSNIKNRVSKGIGYISEIFTILENVCFGSHYFEMALLLREAFLVNGALVNSDIWYNMTLKDTQDIEQLDRVFFSRLLGIPKTSAIESYYLELGVYNLEVYIKSKRIIYFHNLINRNKKQIIYSFVMTQYSKRSKGDWISYVLNDFNDFEINSSFSYLEGISTLSFKKIVKAKAKAFALRKFKSSQANHSKMKNLSYQELKMQEYFSSPNFTTEEKKTLFKWRTRAERFGENFRGGQSQIMCPLCMNHPDSQSLSYQCEVLTEHTKIEGNYSDIFDDHTKPQTMRTINNITKTRKNTIKYLINI